MPGAKGLSSGARGCVENIGIHTTQISKSGRLQSQGGIYVWSPCAFKRSQETAERGLKEASLQRGRESKKGRMEERKWLETSADNLSNTPAEMTDLCVSVSLL